MYRYPSNPYVLAVVVAMAMAPASHAASCPDQIAEAALAVKVDAGWKTFIAAPLYLHSVSATDGPPERLGHLIAKHEASGRGTWTDTYDLRGPFPEGKWLQCSYGMLNEVVLSRRLDDSITSCTIKGRKGEKAGQNVFSVLCY